MTTTANIRAYTENDFDEVLAIFERNVPTYFSESERDDLKHYLQNEIEIYLVAEIGNRIVGAGGINFGNDKQTGIISWDFIDPDFQGKGIGKQLLTQRIEILKGLKTIDSISVRTSQLTFPFYEKSGFETLEIVKDYWAKGFDLYAMVYTKDDLKR